MRETTEKLIESRRAQIKCIRTMLPYADHGAYGQDTEKIRRLESEVEQLESTLVL